MINYSWCDCDIIQKLKVLLCVATQSWLIREYRRGLGTLPCGAPVLRISELEVFFSPLHHLGAVHQEVQDTFAQGRVQTQGPPS